MVVSDIFLMGTRRKYRTSNRYWTIIVLSWQQYSLHGPETRLVERTLLTRAPLAAGRYSAERAPLEWVTDSDPPCLTPERMAVERREKRQTKALNLGTPKILLTEVRG